MLLLMIGACHLIVSAQSFSLGAHAGFSASSYWSAKEAYSGNRLMIQPELGLLLAYPMTERVTLQAELNYAPKGDAWYFDYESGRREDIRDVYNYLEIPLLAKFQILETPLEMYAIGGFYLAHALSNHYTEDDKRYNVNFLKGDFGVKIGGGAALPFGSGKAFAEFRLSQGLKDLDVFGDGTVTRLRGVGLSIGWMMDLQ